MYSQMEAILSVFTYSCLGRETYGEHMIGKKRDLLKKVLNMC